MPTNDKAYNLKYQREYRSQPGKLSDMAQRQRARYAAEKAGKVSPNDGKEVDHIKGTGAGNGAKNLQVISKEANRRKGVQKAIASRKSRMRNGGKY